MQVVMDEPLVSIVCEVYNHEPFIRQCLDGFVMQQTTFPFEILVHDDASTDGSADIIREYEAKHPGLFKPIYQTENKYSKGVNIWAEIQFPRARGKYIAICEGDDFWTDPLKLQKQVDFLESHDDYVMCCSAFSQSFEVEEQAKTTILFDLDEITIDNILKGQWIGTLTTIFRKDAISDYVVPLANLPMGDLPLWGHLALKGRIHYLNDVTANYRRLESSACHAKDEKQQSVFDLAAMKVREYYAIKSDRSNVVRSSFSKQSHFIFDRLYNNNWNDFPVDDLWHFIKEYGNPSGYDKLKYWGLKSRINYLVSKLILKIKNKKY